MYKYNAVNVSICSCPFQAHRRLKSESLQKDVDLANTFEPTNMSLPRSIYDMMVKAMHLPFQWIETSSCVGPFFWSTLTEVEGKPRFRKYK
jgi:hypothetical protein